MSQTFIKTPENFICEHCGAAVQGSGYTNHCPECLWSKHVDINPGDRAATCGGLMPPLSYQKTAKGFELLHRCQLCGYEKRNKLSTNDNLARLATL